MKMRLLPIVVLQTIPPNVQPLISQNLRLLNRLNNLMWLQLDYLILLGEANLIK